MPQVELKYSNDLTFDPKAVLADIETTIRSHDAGAGETKGRAYPAAEFHRTHLTIGVEILPKAHRNKAFMDALSLDLEKTIKAHLTQACVFALMISFSPETHIAGNFEP